MTKTIPQGLKIGKGVTSALGPAECAFRAMRASFWAHAGVIG
jgi:hypothetical protein